MENPAVRRGNPVVSLAVGKIDPEFTPSPLNPQDLQASRLGRLYALTYETAATVASLAYGVAK